MRQLQFANRLKAVNRFKTDFVRRLLPAARLLNERFVARPFRLALPYLKEGLVMRPLLFSFIAIGVVLFFLGVREYRQSGTASAVSVAPTPSASSASSRAKSVPAGPREITCRDLVAKGPGDSAYVRLTDFELTDHYLPRKAPGGSGWQSAYVPAVPLKIKDSPAVRPLNVLVKTSAARNPRELYTLDKAPIEGKVVKGISTLGADEQALLRKSYPQIDLNACWLLEVGKMPAPRATASAAPTGSNATAASSASAGGSRGGFGKIGGGAGLAVLAAGMLLLANRRA
jgi:hypothetical protein